MTGKNIHTDSVTLPWEEKVKDIVKLINFPKGVEQFPLRRWCLKWFLWAGTTCILLRSNTVKGRFRVFFSSILVAVLLGLFISCENIKTNNDKAEEGIVKRKHFPNGNIQAEVFYENDTVRSLSRSYWKSGGLKMEITFQNGLRTHALSYHENGKLYRETTFVNDTIHGIRKIYYSNGILSAQVPYKRGMVCVGLKEYLLDGQPKEKYPTLQIREVNRMLTENKVTLIVSIEGEYRSVEFYRGVLNVEKCLDLTKAIKIKPQKKGELHIDFPLPPGTFRMEEVNIIAKVTTSKGSPLLLSKSYHLAVENR